MDRKIHNEDTAVGGGGEIRGGITRINSSKSVGQDRRGRMIDDDEK